MPFRVIWSTECSPEVGILVQFISITGSGVAATHIHSHHQITVVVIIITAAAIAIVAIHAVIVILICQVLQVFAHVAGRRGAGS